MTARRVVVFGATGGAGRALVAAAAADGRAVTAFGRSEARLREAAAGAAVRTAVGDLTDPAAVRAAVAGQDAAFVVVGPRKGDDPDALTRGVQAVVDAMRAEGVRRLLLLSGAGIHVAGDQKPVPDRLISWLVRRLNGPDVRAKEAQLALVRRSGLDWTVVRPPRLADRPAAGRGLVADPHTIRGGRVVAYAELARWLLDEADAGRHVGEAVFVAAAAA